MNIKVLLNSVEKIQGFVSIMKEATCDIDLISGRDVYLDAKSILGILSCDVRKPMILDIHADSEERDLIISKLGEYLVAQNEKTKKRQR